MCTAGYITAAPVDEKQTTNFKQQIIQWENQLVF